MVIWGPAILINSHVSKVGDPQNGDFLVGVPSHPGEKGTLKVHKALLAGQRTKDLGTDARSKHPSGCVYRATSKMAKTSQCVPF